MTTLEFFDYEMIIKKRFPEWKVARGTTDLNDNLVQFTLYRNQDRNEVFVTIDTKSKTIVDCKGCCNLDKLQ